MIEVFTDGASSGNPGKGGYGILMRLKGTSYEKTFSEGFRLTTNNRMELLAVIVALENITKPNQQVIIYSDSKYVVDAINLKWIFGWEKKSFSKVKNSDLWLRFLKVYRKHKVNFIWVKGHNGHPENERVDFLATSAIKKDHLKIDSEYERTTHSEGLL
ncbi:ribonuclease HI [Apibacter muscae]|uniref:ribonuclease H n=1 Tax=Apibacter muscae TaxID=2509004 RepID=A0A563DL55_9FLAO|nr:ribonuclease HI [Apibacter muscae]TWP30613.1 ribonuclease HI [Apibacter muscae]TWP31449.1 ribonuclease HI [Apibacter muscae]